MTATLPVPAAPAGTPPQAGNRPAAHRAVRPAGRARRVLLHTPGKLWALGLGLVLLSLAWGGFGGWVTEQHASAADSLATANARLTFDSRQLYQSIADADATITAAFLASPTPPLNQLQRYQLDLATAHANLSGLQAASHSPAIGDALASLGSGLSAYSGYVAEATAEYADGHPLTGGSFLQVASEEAHLSLLPAAKAVYSQENEGLNTTSGQATGLVTMIGLLVLAAVTLVVLYRAQRWLYRRTNRVLSPGLAFASVVLFISLVWVAAAFFSARSDLSRGISHGSAPAQSLAQASIGVQQIRGDAVLNVISRSGNASFSDDFATTSRQIDTWLSDAARVQENTGQENTGQQNTGQGSAGQRSNGSALVAAAQRDAATWYTANKQVYQADKNANYAGERALVIGGISGNTVTGYNILESDLSQAIRVDQDIFTSAAADGASALDPLTEVVAVGSVLMAFGCGWTVSRRLAEYR